MRRALNLYERVTGVIAGVIGGVAVLLLMTHTVINALGRSLFNSPVPGTLEYAANWYLPSIVLIGLVLAQQRGQHIEAPLLYDKTTKPVQRELTIIGLLAMIGVSVFFAWYGFLEADYARTLELTAGVSGVVIWPALYTVPLGFGLLSIQALIDVIRTVWPRLGTEPETAVSDRAIDTAIKAEGVST